jgi:hypothetical protein
MPRFNADTRYRGGGKRMCRELRDLPERATGLEDGSLLPGDA